MSEPKIPERMLQALRLPLWKPKPSEPEARPGIRYASFNRRMIAQIIDSLLVTLLLAAPIEIMAISMFGPMPEVDFFTLSQQASLLPADQQAQLWADTLTHSGVIGRWLEASFLQLGILGVITVLFWNYFSATPGKMIMRLAVVDADTLRPLTNKQAVIRFFAYFVSTFPLLLGFFWVCWSARRQGWHDYLAHSVVVVLPRGVRAEDLHSS